VITPIFVPLYSLKRRAPPLFFFYLQPFSCSGSLLFFLRSERSRLLRASAELSLLNIWAALLHLFHGLLKSSALLALIVNWTSRIFPPHGTFVKSLMRCQSFFPLSCLYEPSWATGQSCPRGLFFRARRRPLEFNQPLSPIVSSLAQVIALGVLS